MHVLALARTQALLADRADEPRHRAVVQPLWRLDRHQSKIDRDRMPLVRADALSIIAQCKALLVAGRHDVLQPLAFR